MKKLYLLFLFLGLLGVMACGSIYEPEPVGIGTDYSELKKSPCACLKIDLVPELPQWFS